MLQLVTDSSADLPKDLLEKYCISVVPLTIHLDGKDYQEGIDLSPQDFAQKMLQSTELPKTSQPTPTAFANVFKALSGKGQLLCLTISSGLSGTCQSAHLAKEMSGTDATIFDTLSGSLGHGLQVLKAAKLAAQGLSLEKILEALKEYRSNMNVLILLNTLENIVKGGRLSKFQGSIAKILDIKILLQGIDGKVELLEKIRGKRKLLQRTLEMIGEKKKDFSEVVFGITHLDNPVEAEYLKEEIIKRFHPKEVLVNYMGATMGTYAGKGGIIVSWG
jgi:DegV family protein with EDD domain